MRRAITWCLRLKVIAAIGLMGTSAAAAPPSESDLAQVRRAARRYLEALAASDRARMKPMRPLEPDHQYGPYPFAAAPRLGQPKVDAHRAGLEFQGKATDPDLPAKGVILLTKEDKDPAEPWKVRTIVWYEKLPRGLRLPKTSVTADDVAQEGRVLRAVESYLGAWRKQDWARMKVLTFDWLSRKPKRRTRARLKSADLRLTSMPTGEVKVDYTAKVLFYGFLPKTVGGRLYCVREGDEWKVRGDAFLL